MPTEMFTMEAGKTTKPTVSVFTAILMERAIQASGKKTSSTVKESKRGPTAPVTKDNTLRVASTDMESSLGPTTATTQATLWTITLKAKVSMKEL